MGKFYASTAEELRLYAKQLAWFHSVPEAAKAHKAGAEKEPQLSRGEKIIANGGILLMPPIGDAAYIIQYWQELGIVNNTGMGSLPLNSQEILSWCEGTGVELSAWEFQIIRDISKAYLVELREAEKLEKLPPYGDPVNQFDRATVSKKVTNAFKAFMMSKKD